MVNVADKLAYFQAITGLQDVDFCTEILSAHGWDLEQVISTFTATTNSENPSSAPASGGGDVGSSGQSNTELVDGSGLVVRGASPPGLAWKLITLLFSIIFGSLGLISGAIEQGM